MSLSTRIVSLMLLCFGAWLPLSTYSSVAPSSTLVPDGTSKTGSATLDTTSHTYLELLDEDQLAVRRLAATIEVADPGVRNTWAEHILRYSAQSSIPPQLLVAIIQHESRYDSLAVNRSDPSYGLTQVMPFFWHSVFTRECGSVADSVTLRNPRIAICYGANVFGWCWDRHEGDTIPALQCYNGNGEGYAQRVLEALDG